MPAFFISISFLFLTCFQLPIASSLYILVPSTISIPRSVLISIVVPLFESLFFRCLCAPVPIDRSLSFFLCLFLPFSCLLLDDESRAFGSFKCGEKWLWAATGSRLISWKKTFPGKRKICFRLVCESNCSGEELFLLCRLQCTNMYRYICTYLQAKEKNVFVLSVNPTAMEKNFLAVSPWMYLYVPIYLHLVFCTPYLWSIFSEVTLKSRLSSRDTSIWIATYLVVTWRYKWYRSCIAIWFHNHVGESPCL